MAVHHKENEMIRSIPTLESVECAERVLKLITEHPEVHQQEVWFAPAGVRWDAGSGLLGTSIIDEIVREAQTIEPTCGTTACFAGWVAADQKMPMWYSETNLSSVWVGAPVGFDECPSQGAHIAIWAANFLGLGVDGEADWDESVGVRFMFDSDATLDDIALWVEGIRLAYENQVTTESAVTELALARDAALLEASDG